MKKGIVKTEHLNAMTTKAICSYFGVLPSQVDKEPADNLNMIMAILAGEGRRAQREKKAPATSQHQLMRQMKHG